jgi:opacity protein-like surface antigen
MKNIIFVAGLALALAMPVQAADTETPKTKRVCVDVKDKAGQPVKNKDGSTKQNCRDVKQHKKHEGTKVPDKK